MVHQKINYVLILFLAVLLLAGCKEKSKEYTTVIWEVVNPVTNEPYTNMLVRLYEAKKKNNGIEYKVLFEGKTNQVGIAEFSFKANLTSRSEERRVGKSVDLGGRRSSYIRAVVIAEQSETR